MNLILLFKEDFVGSSKRVRISGRRYEHIISIHRVSAGDELCVGLADGKIGTGKVTSLGDGFLEMDVILTKDPPTPLAATLVLALPRPIVLRRIILTAASMGVKKIFLIGSARVEKSYWQSPALKDPTIREQLILGLEQAKDTVMPQVMLRKLFKPFVEDELPSIIKSTLAITAHPESPEACPRAVAGPVTLAVGPEGGFVPYETDKLREAGFSLVNMGERILRVETAIPALLSRLF